MRGMKQEALAADLGEEWTQRKVSLLETKEEVEPEILELVAKVLNVSTEAIKNFDESAISNINTFYDNSAFNFQCSINPIERWVEALDKNEKLYERLLQSEREKNELLQKLLDNK